MRAVPNQAVAVMPVKGQYPLYRLVLQAVQSGNLSVEFCDDGWRPLAAAGPEHPMTAGVSATLATIVGGASAIPAGASRVRCYTTTPLLWNLSGNSDWSYAFAPAVNQIPANTEFDFPEVS